MLLTVAIAAALARIAGPSTIDLRLVRMPHTSAHILRLSYDVEVAGVRAKETGTYDAADGRYVERLSAGPLSESSGFDGVNSWTADATGMPEVDDHPNTVVDDLASAHFMGRRGPEKAAITILRQSQKETALRLRYPGLAGPIGVTLSRPAGRVIAIDDYSAVDPTHTRYGDYREVRGFVLPFSSYARSPERTSTERLRSVTVLKSVPEAVFAPPPEPKDWSISGSGETTVSLGDLKDNAPVVDVRVNGGPVLHMLFDSGSSNTMSTHTARRLGLKLIGADRTGGIGTGLLRERFAAVRRMQIGAATMRNQTFAIFDDTSSKTDGTIGCEVLQRFIVRFDFVHSRLTLANRPDTLHERYAPLAMHLEGCQPEVRASLDGFAGAFGIDTGSGAEIDVMAPFVRAHDLIARYHAKVVRDGDGIGGAVYAGVAAAKHLAIGGYTVDDISIDLSTMHGGAFDDPTQIGNIGVGLLRDFVVTFDYRKRRMWLM